MQGSCLGVKDLGIGVCLLIGGTRCIGLMHVKALQAGQSRRLGPPCSGPDEMDRSNSPGKTVHGQRVEA